MKTSELKFPSFKRLFDSNESLFYEQVEKRLEREEAALKKLEEEIEKEKFKERLEKGKLKERLEKEKLKEPLEKEEVGEPLKIEKFKEPLEKEEEREPLKIEKIEARFKKEERLKSSNVEGQFKKKKTNISKIINFLIKLKGIQCKRKEKEVDFTKINFVVHTNVGNKKLKNDKFSIFDEFLIYRESDNLRKQYSQASFQDNRKIYI